MITRIARTFGIGVSLLAAVATSSAGQHSTCSRVLAGAVFPRHELVEAHTVVDHATVDGVSGNELLFVRRWDPLPPTDRYYLQSGVPNGAGRITLGEAIALDDPSTFSRPRELISGDFDGDGIDDAIVYWAGNSSAPMVFDWFRGLAPGYAAPFRKRLGSSPHVGSPLAGDFDGDGKLELVTFLAWGALIHGMSETGYWVFEGYLGGVFASPTVVDWNGDSSDDLASLDGIHGVNIALGDPLNPLSVSEQVVTDYPIVRLSSLDRALLAIEGTTVWFLSSFEAVHRLAPGAVDAWTIDLPENSGDLYPPVDLDGDGREDLMHGVRAHVFWGGSAGFDVRWGESEGAPTPGPQGAGRDHPIASLDLNGDGVHDLVTSDFGALIQDVPRTIEEGLFASVASDGDFVDEPYLYLDVGDLDEDGLDDVVFESFYPHVIGTGRSGGDGTFSVSELDVNPRDLETPVLIDLDGDGHLDVAAESGPRAVGWGVGDGTFDPIDIGSPQFRWGTRRFGELDGDGVRDVVEIGCPEYPCDPMVVTTALGAARLWHETPFRSELPRDDYGRPWALADLDGDGLDDLVLLRGGADPSAIQRLVWRPALGDGSFGAESVVVDHEVSYVDRIVPTDFDLDGVTDLFVMTWRWSDAPYMSVRSDGTGEFEVVWTGPATDHGSYGLDDRLYDVDGDGRPDLVSGQYDGYFEPFYYVRVRRGDGLGGFLPAEPTWRGAPGPPGRFRADGGRDMVRLLQFNSFRLNLELFPSLGHVLPRDVAPPHVEIALTRRGAEPIWRVTTVPIDECDDAPRIVRRVIEMLPVRPHPEPTWEHAGQFEIRVFEVPSQKRRDVLLLGPDEDRARRLYADAVDQGGVPFEHFRELELGVENRFGEHRGSTIRAARLAQRFVFRDGRLVGAFATRPGGELVFAVDAVDHAGRRGTTRLGFGAETAAERTASHDRVGRVAR